MILIGLGSLGFYCLFASIWGPDFAKLHFSFSFLNFPIFIGEIVLFICLVVSVYLICTKKIQLTRLQYLFLGYLGCVVLRTVYEYFAIGPLALRNAVLFFYPIFAFFAYCFYHPSFFSQRVKALLLVCLVMLSLASKVPFFSFIYFILFFVVLSAFDCEPWVRYLIGAIAFFLMPHTFFMGARTWLVASTVTGVFLIFLFVKYFFKFKMAGKLLVGGTLGAVFLWMAYHFGDKGGIKTLTTPMQIIQGYKEIKAIIRNKGPKQRFAKLCVRLYNTDDDQETFLDMIYQNKKYGPVKNTPVLQKPAGAVQIQKEQGPSYLEKYEQQASWTQEIPVQVMQNHGFIWFKKSTLIKFSQRPKFPVQDMQKLKFQVLNLQKQGPIQPVLPKTKISVLDYQRLKSLQYNDQRDVGREYGDIYFRLLIWEGMIRELWEGKYYFGVGLAHPQRCKDIEILRWAFTDWSRDGWITPHNSFLHLIYRAGIVGLGIICTIFIILGRLIMDFVDRRSVIGVLLSGIIIYGLLAANFLLILELPYYAIPLWTIFGLTLAYRRKLWEGK